MRSWYPGRSEWPHGHAAALPSTGDEIRKRMKKLFDNIDGATLTQENTLTPEFIKLYTKCNDFEELVNLGGPIDNKAWDEYIANNTEFNSWDEMLATARAHAYKRAVQGRL